MNKKILSISMLALALSACGKDKDKEAPSTKTTVALEEASSPDGCLSLPTYFQNVRAMDPGLPVMQSTTRIDLQSKYAIRENYRRQLAYGSTLAQPARLSDLPDFRNVAQDGCSKLTVTDPDGTSHDYTITSASKEKLHAENDDGLGFEYTWLSPQRMLVTQTYNAYDLPCGTDTPIRVSHTKVLDWSGQAPDLVDVDADLVKLIADFTGGDASSVYVDSNGQKLVSEGKLQGLLNQSPKPEMLTCNGLPAPATPTPPAPGENTPVPTPETPNAPTDPSGTGANPETPPPAPTDPSGNTTPPDSNSVPVTGP